MLIAHAKPEGAMDIAAAYAVPMKFRSLPLRAHGVHRLSVVRKPRALLAGREPATVAPMRVSCSLIAVLG